MRALFVESVSCFYEQFFDLCGLLKADDLIFYMFRFHNQFSMEMAGGEIANVPKSYSLNMFKDFVPMCIFSEANQGKKRFLILFPY